MKKRKSQTQNIAKPFPKHFDYIPVELHGHKKKLEFFYRRIEKYKNENGFSEKDVSVLEVGCSNGNNISIPLAKSGFTVTGIDLHQPSIEHAKILAEGLPARFAVMDLFKFNYEEQFDVVILSDVLEHVDDPLRTLSISARHLRPEGIMLICIPNGYGPYENEQRFVKFTKLDVLKTMVRRQLQKARSKNIVNVPYNHESGHVQFFHLNDFRKLLRDAGLEVENMKNGALFGGTLSYGFFNRIPFCAAGSLKLANWLPSKWVTTWYFACKINKKFMANKG
ncbi:class I SAM-dependent methyltransferase [Alphaproteobacteria bacterium]|nr:class I SAM-dependent methyltransferase [Alphaproteobacteria bacterium]